VLLATRERELIADKVARELQMNLRRSPLEHAYYSGGVRYRLWVTPPNETVALPLVDGGSFDWLTKLTSNRRLVFVASGAGSQLIRLHSFLSSK
jgi:hypothetical protein